MVGQWSFSWSGISKSFPDSEVKIEGRLGGGVGP